MKRCPLTYDDISTQRSYSLDGLKALSPQLTDLKPFAYSAAEQREESLRRATKMSIQGLQPKLSVNLSLKKHCFEIVDQGGRYIFKPQSLDYSQLPENEDVTLKLAETVGINVPVHGLIHCKDKSFTFLIKRMDRYGKKGRLHLEDFAQLLGYTRDTKYSSSMEQVVDAVEQFTTFPALEKSELFKRTLFNFIVGNEDMHLKNFSILSENGIHKLAPAYDFLNTTIALKNPKEEIALPLNGKKRNLTRKDFLTYFAKDRLGLTEKVIETTLKNFSKSKTKFEDLLERCFLSDSLKIKYLELMTKRTSILGL